jgi:hypothetical protein
VTTAVSNGLIGRLRKPKWDAQPTQPASVLLASAGGPFDKAAVSQAIELARDTGGAVAVVTIARLYGSAFGLPNPGLMPTKAEMATQHTQVDWALKILTSARVECYGQVATTRHPARSIARVAEARGCTRILVMVPPVPRWRQIIEGDLVKSIARRVGASVVVEAVPG